MIRKLFVMTLLAGMTAAPQAQAALHQLDAEQTGLQITAQSQLGLSLQLGFSSLECSEFEHSGESFATLQLENCVSGGEPGHPAIPRYSRLIQVPLGAELDVHVSAGRQQDFTFNELGITQPLAPAQAPRSKAISADMHEMVMDQAAYAESRLDAAPRVSIEDLGVMRGVRMARVQVEPIQVDVTQETLRLFQDLELQVNFTGADLEATADLAARTRSPYFESVYAGSLINHQAFSSSRDTVTEYPISYVIVTDPMFTAQLADFIEWKTKKGFTVIVGETGSPEVGSTTTSIKAWLQGIYNAATPAQPAPSFVLYVGDDNLIPAWDGGAGSHVTDLDYVLYTGSDDLPEVYYGRFSARDSAQLQAQIDKTLEYEQYQMPDPSFLGQSVLIAGVDSGYAPTHGNGQINYGTTYYFNAAHGITSSTYLYPTSSESWVDAQVVADVSAGAGFVNYTAHGSQTSWADPSFTITNINSLSNAHMYPTVVGNCCLTNSFQVETCFGEAWLRAENKGAIGYIGGSNNTYWDEDYWWGVGYGSVVGSGPTYEDTGLGAYDGAFHDHGEPFADWYTCQSALLTRGNLAVTEAGSSLTTYYWEIYHLMGDPSISTWLGVPDANTVSHPEVIFLGQGSLSLSAEAYSYVGLSVAGELKASGLTDASGNLTLDFDPITVATDADLVITHHQKIPVITTIPCVPNDGAYVTLSSYSPTQAVYGSSVSLDVALENIGTVGAMDVTATLTTANAYASLGDGSEFYGTIVAGATANGTDAFSFSLADGAPDQEEIQFDLSVSGTARDTWTASFNVMAQAPSMHAGMTSIDDAAGGNGNNRMDPGETVTLEVPVTNGGHAATVNGLATLSTTSTWITLLDVSQAVSAITAGETRTLLFDVLVSADAPIGTPAGFSLMLDAGAYDINTGFTFPIGLVLEDFESASFAVFPWEQVGAAPWQIASSPYEGSWCAQSGSITHNEQSQLVLTVDIQSADDISFYYKVSSESNYDYLRFYIDGVEQASWSGTVDWSLGTYPVSVGTHTFMWAYTKDGSVDTGSDCAWIDYIVFPALGLPPAPAIAVGPTNVETWVEPGFIGTEYLTIANQGEGDLNWSASFTTNSPSLASIPAMKLGKDDADPRQGHVSRDWGGPDNFGYTWADSNEPGGPAYSWVDISGIGTAGTFGDDSNSGAISLGFSMPFYGNIFSSVNVCSNGFLSFTSTSTSYTNQGIPTGGEPENLIAPFWDDLNPSSGGTIYTWSDTANGRFIVQWDAVPRYSNTSALETFQAILYSDGRIVFQYETISDALSVTVGIENADGTDGLEVVANADYLTSGMAIEFAFEEPWFFVTPSSGTVLPGGSQQVTLDFSAMEILEEGDYQAILYISSNDPSSPLLSISVVMHVGTLALDAPVLTISSPNACATQIDWDPVPGATAYKIWTRTNSTEPWVLEATTTYTFLDIDCIISGTRRFYRVTAVME